MSKPSILIYGNCQGEHMTHIVRRLSDVHEKFDIKILPPHLVTERDWETRYTEAFFAGVRIVWNQVESGEPNFHRRMLESRLPPGCQTIGFPPMILLCLWPFSGSDPRLAAATDYIYPWPDSIAASLAPSVGGEDPPDDVLFAEYMRLTAEKMPDLERRLRIDGMRAKAVDALADVTMWDWIEENFRTTKLFHSSSHLTALPFGYLVPRLLALTGDLTPVQIARAQREATFLMRGNHGQDTEVVPVHPLIAERMGLTWHDPDSCHRWHAHDWTYREYILKYIRWEPFLP
jgi:hypothetical protein